MTALSFNRSMIFATSHINAKQIRNQFNSYRAAFSAALRGMYATLKKLQNQTPEQNAAELLPEVTTQNEAETAQASKPKKKPRITKVLLHWSESRMFPMGDNQHEYKFSEFEHKCWTAAQDNGPVKGNGYCKTMITVFWDNGEKFERIRLDLATDDDKGFADYMHKIIAFAKTEQGKDYYSAQELEARLTFFDHYELKDAQ